MKNELISERRRFFLTLARSIGLATLGGFVWSAYVDEVTASKLTLRPPGALKEEDFLKTCIKCGMCVEACPFDTLKLSLSMIRSPISKSAFVPPLALDTNKVLIPNSRMTRTGKVTSFIE